MDFAFMAETWLALLAGLPLTLKLAGWSVLCGGALALLLALMSLSRHRALVWPAGSTAVLMLAVAPVTPMYVARAQRGEEAASGYVLNFGRSLVGQRNVGMT